MPDTSARLVVWGKIGGTCLQWRDTKANGDAAENGEKIDKSERKKMKKTTRW